MVIINLSILLIFDFYSGFPKETPKLKIPGPFFSLVYISSENYFVDASYNWQFVRYEPISFCDLLLIFRSDPIKSKVQPRFPIFHCVQLSFTLPLKEGIIARGSYTLRRRRRVITRFITVLFDHFISPVLFIYLCIVFVGGEGEGSPEYSVLSR